MQQRLGAQIVSFSSLFFKCTFIVQRVSILESTVNVLVRGHYADNHSEGALWGQLLWDMISHPRTRSVENKRHPCFPGGETGSLGSSDSPELLWVSDGAGTSVCVLATTPHSSLHGTPAWPLFHWASLDFRPWSLGTLEKRCASGH